MASFVSGPDYLALPRDPYPWIIQDLVPVGGLTNIYGKPKSGKSFALLGMAESIAAGRPDFLMHFPILKHGPTAVLQLDTPRGEWARRIRDLRDNAAFDWRNVYFCDMVMTPCYPFNILMPEQFEWLKNEMKLVKPVVVFIDTLREAHNGDENDSTVMRNVITGIQAACLPAAVVLLSHARKDNMVTAAGGDDLMSDARGSSYVAGRMDTVIKFTAKHMTFKGRAVGEGKLAIQQNEDTGMIQLEGKDFEYYQLLRGLANDLRKEDPKCSINAIAKTIAEHTDYKQLRTINDDVKRYLATCARLCKNTLNETANPTQPTN